MERSHFELIVSRVKAMSKSPKINGTEKTHSLQAGVSLLGSQLEFLSRTSGKKFFPRREGIPTFLLVEERRGCHSRRLPGDASKDFSRLYGNAETWGTQSISTSSPVNMSKGFKQIFFLTSRLEGRGSKRLEADSKDEALGFRPWFCSEDQFVSDQLWVLF